MRLQVLTALAIGSMVWDVIACSVVDMYHRFGGSCFLCCHGSFVTHVVVKPHGVTYPKTVKTGLILIYYRAACKVHTVRPMPFSLNKLCVLFIGQAFRCSPENAFYIFNQQIYSLSDICLTVHH